MSDGELGWVSGYLEGEGSFYTITRKQLRYSYPRLSCVSTDEDVILRLRLVTGVGRVTGPLTRRDHWKPQWVWHVTRQHDAIMLMQAIRPLMGVRRGEAIDAVLAGWDGPHPQFGRVQSAAERATKSRAVGTSEAHHAYIHRRWGDERCSRCRVSGVAAD